MMKAAKQNPMRTMVATAVMVMSVTTMANAARSSAPSPTAPSAPRDNRVNARVVAAYTDGSWLAPTAVVLDSKQAWDEWNANEVAMGRSIGAERAPEGVDWGREAVMVVALGENLNGRSSVKLTTCTRTGTETVVALECDLASGGNSPSLVVALPRGSAHNVNLNSNVTLADMPTKATYVMASSASGSPLSVVVTWGSLKNDYR